MSDEEKIIVLIPVYNDWDCLNELITSINDKAPNHLSGKIQFLIINDGSLETVKLPNNIKKKTDLLTLRTNLGHQKAIAVGLSWLYKNKKYERVAIMDSDGEDKPEDLFSLIDKSVQTPETIIAAKRASRENGMLFSLFYILYKKLFWILTGKKNSFGNFLVLPSHFVERVVYMPEIWNHLSSALIKSRLPISEVPTKRGYRYSGKSKMSFHSLLLHGFGAISVFTEKVTTRLLTSALLLSFLSAAFGVTTICIKYFTNLAIPGWASTMILVSIIILLQGTLLSLFTLFLFLSSKSLIQFIPAIHFENYIRKKETDGQQLLL